MGPSGDARLWTGLIGLATVLALSATILAAALGVYSVVFNSLYVPIALLAFRFRWHGLLAIAALAITYLLTMLALAPGDAELRVVFASRSLVFVAIGALIAGLGRLWREAEQSVAVQRDLTAALSEAPTPDEVAHRAVTTLARVDDIDAALVFLPGPGATVRLAAHAGVSESFAGRLTDVPDGSPRAALLTADRARFEPYLRLLAGAGLGDDDALLEEGLRGVGIVPATGDDGVVATVFVASRSRHFLRGTTAAALDVAVAQVAGALTRLAARRLLEEQTRQLEERTRQLAALVDAARAITSTTDLDAVLTRIAREAAEGLGSPECIIWGYDADDHVESFLALYQRDPDPRVLALLQGTSQRLDPDSTEVRVITERRTEQATMSDPRLPADVRASMERWGEKSLLATALWTADRPIGLLIAIETQRERHFDDQEVAFLSALGKQAAVAIDNARLYRELERRATHDGLTGLTNHRHFVERLVQESARARRSRQPLGVLMLDIDDFKAVNDAHGHLVGDQVLREIAALIAAQIRTAVDLAARYGGEEFAVLLPGVGPLPHDDDPTPAEPETVSAQAVAERIRAAVQRSRPASADVPGGIPVTVSVGVAWSSGPEADAERLLAAADTALYSAKRGGKDRVVVHTDRR